MSFREPTTAITADGNARADSDPAPSLTRRTTESGAWTRIPVATSWCLVVGITGGSVQTACWGRHLLSDDFEIHDSPALDDRCDCCERVRIGIRATTLGLADLVRATR